jgi:hypothetical protein
MECIQPAFAIQGKHLRFFATFEANVANKKLASFLMNQRTGTEHQYDAVLQSCKAVFIAKTEDYGTAWRVLRPISVRDQIYIKAQRIKTIQEKGTQQIGDSIEGEFVGIINYAIIGNIQLLLSEDTDEELDVAEATRLYEQQADAAKRLMLAKNHDYGEAWRNMSEESFVDLILMKLVRIRQIIANNGKTLVSEGLDANFYDIINYAIFASILIGEKKEAA